MNQHVRTYTPDQLAAVWGCSSNHVRNLIHSGELRAFRLGKRLLRIPAEAVGEYEQCQMSQQNSASDASMDNSSSLGGKTESAGVIVLKHSPERQRKPKP